MKKHGFILVSILTLLVIGGCSSTNDQTTVTSTSQTEIAEISIEVSLVKEDEVFEEKTLNVAAESNLMEVMQANFELEEEGGMITSIDGIAQDADESFFWTYMINDEMVNTGAKDTKVHEGDKIVFTYSKF